MKIIETYGNYIEKWSNENPDRARWLLKTGWKAQNLKFRFAPDKRLMPADRYLARLMMDTMLMPLEKPQESAIVSIFTPCELLQEAGIHPYNVEGFSCYLSASKAERAFLQQAENQGIALSREKILNNVWNYDYFGDARTIDTHVKKLRSKLGDKGEYIKTIWGMGYKFEVE